MCRFIGQMTCEESKALHVARRLVKIPSLRSGAEGWHRNEKLEGYVCLAGNMSHCLGRLVGFKGGFWYFTGNF